MVSLGRQGGGFSSTTVLDTWIIALIVTFVFRGRIEAPLVFLALAGYFLTRLVPALLEGAPLEDFLQAYRWLLYLVAFTLALGHTWGRLQGLVRFTWILVGMATIKAALTLIVLGPGERPGLLIENNFELALFCGLAIALYSKLGSRRSWLVGLLGVLTLLSGSRSGAIIYFILFLYAVICSRQMNLLGRYLLSLSAAAAVMFPIYVFSERQGTGQIDRLRFFDVFVKETQSWDALTWLVGTTPITPLSIGACDRLSFYQSLFSSVGDGSCYSVILHSFLLRVVFDAGIVGLLLSIVLPLLLMMRAGTSTLTAFALVAVAVANGASVSGLNNPYVSLPILVAILLGRQASLEVASDSVLPLGGSRRIQSVRRRDREIVAARR